MLAGSKGTVAFGRGMMPTLWLVAALFQRPPTKLGLGPVGCAGLCLATWEAALEGGWLGVGDVVPWLPFGGELYL